MAFRGKLSAGCEPCRLAKKGCDLATPECTRCRNTGKACIGFRDLGEVRIIDESSQVVRKATQAKKSQVEQTLQEKLEMRRLAWDNEHLPSVLRPPSIREAPRTHLLEVSQASFFHTFVVPGHWLFMNDFVSGVTDKADVIPCVLRAARACGMALITNQQKVPEGHLWSQAQYGQAVKDLNASLTDHEVARDDQTLCTVLLLCFYESLTCDPSKGTQDWRAHVRGATEILRLRGLEAAQTPVGAALFYELRPSIAIDCVWHSKPIPRFIREWPEHLEGHKVPGLVAVDQLFGCVSALADLRAAIAARSSTDLQLYNRASVIEKAMIDWARQVSTSPKWHYFAVLEFEQDKSDAFGSGTTHRYRSPRELGAWNMYRTYRLILSKDRQMLWQRLALRDTYLENKALVTFTLLRQGLVNDICASVPCALGLLGPFGHPDSAVIQAYSLVWPLFFAGRCSLEDARYRPPPADKDGMHQSNDVSPTDNFLWIITKLRYIQKQLGISWVGGIIGVLVQDLTVHEDFNKLIRDRNAQSLDGTIPQSCHGVPGCYEGCENDDPYLYPPTKPSVIRRWDLEEEPDIVSYV